MIKLATGQWAGALAVDDTNVYWSNGFHDDAGTIASVPIDGGSVQTLLQATVAGALVQQGDALYFTALFQQPLARVTKDGGSLTYLPSGNVGGCPLAIDTDYIYVGNQRMPLDGGAGVVLQNGYSAGCVGYDVALDSQRLYWPTSYGGTVVSLPIDGGSLFTVASGLSLPQGVAVDATTVYWTTYGATGSIQCTASGGGGVVVTLATNQFYPNAIVVDGANLYYTLAESPDGAIMRMPKTGGTPTVLAPKQALPSRIAVDATSVYWTNDEDGTVMKLTPK